MLAPLNCEVCFAAARACVRDEEVRSVRKGIKKKLYEVRRNILVTFRNALDMV